MVQHAPFSRLSQALWKRRNTENNKNNFTLTTSTLLHSRQIKDGPQISSQWRTIKNNWPTRVIIIYILGSYLVTYYRKLILTTGKYWNKLPRAAVNQHKLSLLSTGIRIRSEQKWNLIFIPHMLQTIKLIQKQNNWNPRSKLVNTTQSSKRTETKSHV